MAIKEIEITAIKEIELLDNEIGFSIKNNIFIGDTVLVVKDSEIFYGFYVNSINRKFYISTQDVLNCYLRYDVIRIIKNNRLKDIVRGKDEELDILLRIEHKDLEIYHTRLVLFEKKIILRNGADYNE